MYRITSVEYTGGRVVVKAEGTDGEAGLSEKYTVAKELFAPLGVAEGDMLDDDGILSLSSAADLTDAISKALDVLSRSNVSRRALTDKLRLKYRVGKEAAEAAADYAVRRGYLDEVSQASHIAKSDVKIKLWGPRRIYAELMAKGYPAEAAKTAADSVTPEEYSAALSKLVDKKVRFAPADRAEYDKLISSLIRLGHSPSQIKETIAEKFGRDR